jgi:zinc protease
MSMSTTTTRRAAIAVSALYLLLFVHTVTAQVSPEPQREQLLNGLRLLLWVKPGDPDVLLKLRIHSGAAFDLAGKAGQMTLLGDMLFPDPATNDFFTNEMGGKLNVTVNYDSITVTMVGKAEQFEHIVEMLRNALLATQLTPEVVSRVRDARIKIVRDTAISPTTVADRAISARLFGDFPYSRPPAGSSEDLLRVDRGDLMLARDRFLNSNNATLAIVGGVTKPRAMRTLRQLLGPWRKSEQVVPTTFRQPKFPDARTLIVSSPGTSAEIRLALRGLSRSDPDFVAAILLAKLAQHRWVGMKPDLATKAVFVRSESYFLPGMFVMGGAVNEQTAADSLATAKSVIDSLVTIPATVAELERAKSEVASDTRGLLARAEAVPDPWLDLDTYHLSSVQDPSIMLQSITPADLQRLAARLSRVSGVATVVAGDPLQLKSTLQGKLQFEVLGEIAAPVTSPIPPKKPGNTDSPR